MERRRYTKIAVRAAKVASALLVFIVAVFILEQWRARAETKEVLSALLSELILRNAPGSGVGRSVQSVLQREAEAPATWSLDGSTMGPIRWGSWRQRWDMMFDEKLQFPQADRATRISFILRNIIPSAIRPELHPPQGVKVVNIPLTEWEQYQTYTFHQLFPNFGGHIAISQPGINFSKTEAIAYADFHGEGAVGGAYVLMKKVNGVWRIVDEHDTWMY